MSCDGQDTFIEIRPRHIHSRRERLHVHFHISQVCLDIVCGIVHKFLIQRSDFQILHFRLQLICLARAFAPFYQIGEAQMKQVEVKRLRDIVVGTALQTAQFLLLRHTGRKHDKRYSTCRRIILDSTTELITIHLWHHHVGKHNVRGCFRHKFQCFLAVHCRQHLIVRGKKSFHKIQEIGTVVDN